MGEEGPGGPVDPAAEFRIIRGVVDDDELILGNPGDEEGAGIDGRELSAHEPGDLLRVVHAVILIDIIIAVDAVDRERQGQPVVLRLPAILVKPAGQAFQVAQPGHGVEVDRVVQVGNQHLLAGIAQLDGEDQVQHV